MYTMDRRDSLLFYERSPIKRIVRVGPASPNPFGAGLGLSESPSGHFSGNTSGGGSGSGFERSGGSGQGSDDSVSFDMFVKVWHVSLIFNNPCF